MQQDQKLDLDKIPPQFKSDVYNYIENNDVQAKMEDLPPELFFQFWLNWHGLINFDQPILVLLRSLQKATNRKFV